MHGRRVAVVLGEFGFLAGSIGRAAADRLVAAVERATREGLPLLAAPVSGGTRMQEGTPAFVQMVRISAGRDGAQGRRPALPRLPAPPHDRRRDGVVGLARATSPSPSPARWSASSARGSTRRSTASRSPRACRPPRTSTPAASSTRSSPPEEIAGILDRALDDPAGAPHGIEPPCPPRPRTPIPDVDTWDAVTRSRRPDRPGVRRLLKYAASDVVPLNGTGQGEADPGLLIALVRFGDAPCVFLGQDRRGQTADHPMGPEALREARRGMRLASELGLPLVTVIDTQGAALSPAAENGGLAGEIARCLADLVTLDAPTLCLMLGEGNGGGALALLPADRVVAAQHALALAAAAGGRERDRAPRPRPRPRDGARPAGAGARPARAAASWTGSWPRSRTPPTSPRRSASGSARCSSTSWPSCSPPAPGPPADRAARYI